MVDNRRLPDAEETLLSAEDMAYEALTSSSSDLPPSVAGADVCEALGPSRAGKGLQQAPTQAQKRPERG
eukprot:86996-Prorocentrum_minimum.AAC.2